MNDSPPQSDDLVDREILETLRMLGESDNDPGFINQIIDLFLDDVPRQLALLRRALEEGDADAFMRAAHKLKGSCANLGIKQLSHQFRALEIQGRAGDLSGAAVRIDEIETDFDVVRELLEAEKKRG